MAETTESKYYTDEEEEEDMVEEKQGQEEEGLRSEGDGEMGSKKRERSLNSLDGLSKRGVCYLSRVPPHMNPSHVRQMLSKYGEVQRVYLVPQGQGHRKHTNVRAKAYSEGWIEFAKKGVAKRVANLLNGEQIGGKKKSSFYYDIWNIKYLRKFKWDDLVGEIAEKTHIREQKLTLEITTAKKQRDHYLSNVEKSRTLKFIQERRKKKQKTEGTESSDVLETKIARPIPQQKKPVEETGSKTKSKLSRDILAGFKEECNTEKKIIAKLKTSPEKSLWLEKEGSIRCGLFNLLQNIVLIRDPEDSTKFYPRFNLEDTSSFRDLDEHSKNVLRRLYYDYYFAGQENLWRQNALKTLPVLLNSSDMLACGEDLGLILACVHPVMQELGLIGLRIQRMPSEPNLEFGIPSQYSSYMTVCAPSCHDCSTLRAWWEEDEGTRSRFYKTVIGSDDEPPSRCTPEVVHALHCPAAF